MYKKNTFERVAQVIVTDLNSRAVTLSNELGLFNFNASIGDTLVFNKTGYAPQKMAVNNASDLLVYMQPEVYLKEVTIKGTNTHQELTDVINTYRSKGLYYDGKPPISAFNPFGGSPLTGLHELFSKDAANERRFIKFSKQEEEAVQVNRRYTKRLVKQVTALPDTDVINLMHQYKPTIDDIKKWTDYELVSEIKKYLEYYNENKTGSVLQKLY